MGGLRHDLREYLNSYFTEWRFFRSCFEVDPENDTLKEYIVIFVFTIMFGFGFDY